jgi:hypothetical protein
VLGAKLAGEAIGRCVAEVGGGVPRQVGLSVGAGGIATGGGFRRPVMLVDTLDENGGRDVKDRRPPTTPSHARTLPFSAHHSRETPRESWQSVS